MDDEQQLPTRERILAAGAAIIADEGVTAHLSVRAVAARAGVSTGSLRHHSPTQQQLRDELMRRIYEWLVPADSIEDTSIPPRERLVGCLRQLLEPVPAGQGARENMIALTQEFIAAEHTTRVREAYLAMERDGQRRIEAWLRVLADEIDIPPEDIPRRARFLSVVTEGMALKRALPAEDGLAEAETDTLRIAVDAALQERSSRSPTGPQATSA